MSRYMSMLLAGTMVLAGCGQSPQEGAPSTEMATQDAVAGAGPGIAVTAAPGVAFNYRYAFRLPPARISVAQETHAASCEKLGVSRCRITGMKYDLIGTDRVDAMLAFKLDPALARAFGREGIAAIEAADGMLVSAAISGTDAGAAIARSEGDRSQAAAEIERIDRELARPGIGAAARAELQRQRAEIEQRIRAARAATTEQRESLASTPMTFDYESGEAIRGFDAGSPLTSAANTAITSFQATMIFLLQTIALLGPPLLLLGALLWIALRVRRLWPRKPATASVEESPPP